MKKNQPLPGVSFRIDPELKKQLCVLAENDQRTFSNYVIKLLRDHVEKSKPRRNGLSITHDKGVAA